MADSPEAARARPPAGAADRASPLRPATAYVVRHGESAVNAGRESPADVGPRGSSLSGLGRAQARALAAALRGVPFDAVYSSDLARAHETAVLLAADRAAGPVVATARLREGSAAHDPPAAAARLAAVLREIARERPGQTVAVVTHGYVMRAFLVGCGHATLDALPAGAIANGGYVVCRVAPGGPVRVERTRGVRLAAPGAPRGPGPEPEEREAGAGVVVRRVRADDPDERAEWLRLRWALWPAYTLEDQEREMAALRAEPDRAPVFVAVRPDGELGGLVEAALHETAPGCTTAPVGYLEAWYVDPDLRRRGVGRRLVAAAEAWARAAGCRELASDTTPAYPLSPAAHAALGYEDAGEPLHYRKRL
jgi:aminoglycoside 6'-N-acetyltransferase I